MKKWFAKFTTDSYTSPKIRYFNSLQEVLTAMNADSNVFDVEVHLARGAQNGEVQYLTEASRIYFKDEEDGKGQWSLRTNYTMASRYAYKLSRNALGCLRDNPFILENLARING